MKAISTPFSTLSLSKQEREAVIIFTNVVACIGLYLFAQLGALQSLIITVSYSIASSLFIISELNTIHKIKAVKSNPMAHYIGGFHIAFFFFLTF